MKIRKRPDGPTALDLVEEATHLVRCVPLSCAAAYVAGVVPFLLGATFFVADMSRGAYAALHLPGASLGMVAAFAWMKTWQAVAGEEALAYLEQRPPQRLDWRGWGGLAFRQFCAHAIGLLVLPLGLVAALPAGWVYAYYQNVTVLGISAGTRTHRVAWQQARLWPGQNHGALSAISLLGLIILVNVAMAIYLVPALVRTITGTERVFAQTGWNPLNTTFLAAAFALTFLVLDPVLKAFYVLRCFYGRSRRTGVDLLVQVRSALSRTALVIGMVALVGASVADRACADETPETTGETSVETPPVEKTELAAPPPVVREDVLQPADLDASLDRVLTDPDYIWREPPPPRAQGAISDFAAWVRRTLRSFSEWLRRLFGSDDDDVTVSEGRGLGVGANLFLWVLVIAALVLLALVVVSIVRRTQAAARSAPGVAQVATTPSLEREDVTADQLPEDEWMRLARELIARGEVRLGLRALFLGSLAGLAARGLLVLARHKSNRDYERELLRRGAPLAPAAAAFAENRRAFEGAWYGDHRPAADAVARFEENVRLLVRKEGA